MRLGVQRVPSRREVTKQGKGLLAPEQWPMVAAGHPFRQCFKIGIEPDGKAALEDERPSLVVDERAAAGRDHFGRSLDQACDNPPLSIAETRLSKAIEYLGNLMVCRPFDLVVRIHKVEAQPPGEPPSHRALAGAHQPDEDNRSVELGKRAVHVGWGYTGCRLVGQKAAHA